MLISRLCTQDQCETAEYRAWCAKMREVPRLHRKQWEFCYIAQALYERGLLAPGKRGLGFGVGREPLPALFASFGCAVVATDLHPESPQAGAWINSGQHAVEAELLNERGICASADFQRLVSYQSVDMNAVPAHLVGFDFVWSSCALEHLCSIERGQQFVYRTVNCLKPGGVAVHTTEFNVSSDEGTLTTGGTVLFRKRDIEEMAAVLTAQGYMIALDFDAGSGPADQYVDAPPYTSEPHLKLLLAGYVATSLVLVIE